jgi:hypothetical protein
MNEFAPVCKFTYMQNNLHMCKFGHENGALDSTNQFKRNTFTVFYKFITMFDHIALLKEFVSSVNHIGSVVARERPFNFRERNFYDCFL